VCVDVDDPVKGTVQLNMNIVLMYTTVLLLNTRGDILRDAGNQF